MIDVKMKQLLTGIDRLSVCMKMASKWRLVIFQMDHQEFEYEQLYEYLTKGTYPESFTKLNKYVLRRKTFVGSTLRMWTSSQMEKCLRELY